MNGFRDIHLEVIDFHPRVDDLPLVVDDWTLAYRLGFRGKFLWFVILNREKMYKTFEIEKSSGGKRLVHDPLPAMRAIHNRLRYLFLSPLVAKLPDCVSAYRTGKSTIDAAKQHLAGCPTCAPLDEKHTCEIVTAKELDSPKYYITRQNRESCGACQTIPKHDCPRQGTKLKFDLKNFFHSTRRAWITQYFNKTLGYNHYVSSLFAQLMTTTIKRDKLVFQGVPQGAPASGDICNLVAHERLDKPLMAAMSGWTYTRYADDLYFSHPKKLDGAAIEAAIGEVMRCIDESGYRCNKKKTKIQTTASRQQVLGVVLNTKMTMPRDRYGRLRCLLHNCYMYGFESQATRAHKENGFKLHNWLKGQITYYKRIDPYKAATLHARLKLAEERHAVELGAEKVVGEREEELVHGLQLEIPVHLPLGA